MCLNEGRVNGTDGNRWEKNSVELSDSDYFIISIIIIVWTNQISVAYFHSMLRGGGWPGLTHRPWEDGGEEEEGGLEDKFAFSFVSSPADSLNY